MNINEILKKEERQEAKIAARNGSKIETELTEEEIRDFKKKRKETEDK